MLPIADAHVHFWDLERHRYPWLEPVEPSGPFGKNAAIRKTYLLDDYLADATRQNVTRMAHIEAGWDPADPLGEMRWIQELADARGAPHGHVAHSDLASEDAETLIEQHAAFPLFRGVRDRLLDGDFTSANARDARIDDPAWHAGLKLLDRRGLTFDVQAPPALAAKAAELAKTFSGVQFVLTGAGYPPSPDDSEAWARWRDRLRMLADVPNIVTKLSCLMLTEKKWTPEHAEVATETVAEIFGPDRVLVASNFPVDRLFASLDELFGHYRRWFAHQPEADQRKMLHDNTVRVYGLGQGAR